MKTLLPWKTLARKPVFSGGAIREIAQETVELPDGRVIDDYFTADMGDYAIVYATTQDGRVLMLRQYKHGVGRVCLTFPGGYVAPGEDPAVAVARELLEETGYRCGPLMHLGTFVVNPNQGCHRAHLYRADACWPERAPASGDLEEMELVTMAPGELDGNEAFTEMATLPYVTLTLLAQK